MGLPAGGGLRRRAAGVAAGAAMARPMSVPIRKLPWPIRPLGPRGARKS